MTGAAVYFILGLSLLLATVLPQVTRRIAISPPMVLVAVGMGVGMLPLLDGVSLEPQDHRDLITHVTEFTVLVSLMGVGLALLMTTGCSGEPGEALPASEPPGMSAGVRVRPVARPWAMPAMAAASYSLPWCSSTCVETPPRTSM